MCQADDAAQLPGPVRSGLALPQEQVADHAAGLYGLDGLEVGPSRSFTGEIGGLVERDRLAGLVAIGRGIGEVGVQVDRGVGWVAHAGVIVAARRLS